MNGILSALGRMSEETSAVVQLLLLPVSDSWQEPIKRMIRETEKNPGKSHFSWNPLQWIVGLVRLFVNNIDDDEKKSAPEEDNEEDPIDDEGLMKEKVKKTGYRAMIRIITTSDDEHVAETELKNIVSSFSQFASPAYNRFQSVKRKSLSLLLHHYVLRQFVWWQREPIFNIEELATLYHFPHSKYNKQPEIKWQHFKFVKAPTNIPKEGLYLGDNIFRGEKKKIYLANEDRFRHFYVIGQTGTGKSSILTIMARQDLRNHR